MGSLDTAVEAVIFAQRQAKSEDDAYKEILDNDDPNPRPEDFESTSKLPHLGLTKSHTRGRLGKIKKVKRGIKSGGPGSGRRRTDDADQSMGEMGFEPAYHELGPSTKKVNPNPKRYVASKIKAGGPGSGRKPEWQSDSKNVDKLNQLHDHLTSKHGAMKYNYSYKDKDGSVIHTYVPKKKEKYGFAHGQKIIEKPNGEHQQISAGGPGSGRHKEATTLGPIKWHKLDKVGGSGWNDDIMRHNFINMKDMVHSNARSAKIVKEYMEKIRAGKALSPLMVERVTGSDKYSFTGFGGNHRFAALKKLGYTDEVIPVLEQNTSGFDKESPVNPKPVDHIEAGGPGSGWTHEEGHVSHALPKGKGAVLAAPKFTPAAVVTQLAAMGLTYHHTAGLRGDYFVHGGGIANNKVNSRGEPFAVAFNNGKWRLGFLKPNGDLRRIMKEDAPAGARMTKFKQEDRGVANLIVALQDHGLKIVPEDAMDRRIRQIKEAKDNPGPFKDQRLNDRRKEIQNIKLKPQNDIIKQANDVAKVKQDIGKMGRQTFDKKKAEVRQNLHELNQKLKMPAGATTRVSNELSKIRNVAIAKEANNNDAVKRLQQLIQAPGRPNARDAVGNLPTWNEPKTKPAEGKIGTVKTNDSPVEQALLTTPVKEAKTLGTPGVNSTTSYKIKFDDGNIAAFKPASGECKDCRINIAPGLAPEREAAAYRVAKLVGMDDLVAPTVIRTISVDGKPAEKGSLQQWQEGTLAREASFTVKFDGDTDLKRAAIFDYVIGNTDRNSGNWLVKTDDVDHNKDKLRLIDHGLAFPEKPTQAGMAWFGGQPARGGAEAFMNESDKRGLRLSSDDVAPYVQKTSAIAASMKSFGFSKPAINGVIQRISNLKIGVNKFEPFARVRELDQDADYGSPDGLRTGPRIGTDTIRHNDGYTPVLRSPGLSGASSTGMIRIMKTVGMDQVHIGTIFLRDDKITIMGPLSQQLLSEEVINKHGAFDAQHNPNEWFAGLPRMSNAYMQFEKLGSVEAGGPGSGRHKEFGTPVQLKPKIKLRLSQKALIAKKNYVPANMKEHRLASVGEAMVKEAIGGKSTGTDSEPFDVISGDGKHAIEVKTMMKQGNDKITMHQSAIDRKNAWASKNNASIHTIVLDARQSRSHPDVYYREGVGSFRLANMTKLSGMDAIKGVIK